VTVVEFVDFECPFCRKMHASVAPILKANAAKVRIVRKQVPLSMHPHAESAARAYLCGTENGAKADDLAEVFFTAPPEELSEEPAIATAAKLGAPEDKVRECMHDARTTTRLREDGRAFGDANGEGVPLTFVGSQRLDGAVDADTFEAALKEELGKAR
jgi:protein-disulfide isomerase